MAEGPRSGTDAKPIDWGEISRRLHAAAEVLERTRRPSAGEGRRILQARAKELAREKDESRPAEERLEVVEFLLAHERYGIQFSSIREACTVKEITPLPGTPPFVTGIVNVRGRIFSVIDLKKFFNLPDKGLSDQNRLIILGSGTMEFAILADAIVGLRSLAAGDLRPLLAALSGIRQEYLRGVTQEGLIVLDADKILSDKRIVVHEEV